jgi:hypothetical protein
MKLQLLKEQVIKEMRQIKKTAFVGFPECTLNAALFSFALVGSDVERSLTLFLFLFVSI